MGSINQALSSDKILRVNDFELLGMVSSFDWTPDLSPQDIYEFGNQAKVDTSLELRTSGTIEFGSIGNTAGILARMIPSRDAVTGAFGGYMYNSGGANGKNGYTLTEADLAETRFDLIQHERPNSKSFSRSLWFPRCSLASMTGGARADGFATESYAFRGADLGGFNTPYHDIRSIPAVRASGTTAQLADSAMTGYTLAFVQVNDRKFRNSTTSDATKFSMSVGGLLTLTTTEGYTLAVDADIQAVVYKTSGSTTFPQITSQMRGTSAFYVRGFQSNIYIAPATPTAPLSTEQFLCVQSLDWTIDFGLQELQQIARNDKGTAVYFQTPTFPFDISANATVYESDWKDWFAIMTGKTNTDVYTSHYEFAPASLKTSFAIVCEYWTKNNPAAKIQVTTFGDMAPSGRGVRTGLRGRGEVSWSFRGTKVQIQGFNV
jgi:hypothetical protein